MNPIDLIASPSAAGGVLHRAGSTVILVGTQTGVGHEFLTAAIGCDGTSLQALWRDRWSTDTLPAMAILTVVSGETIVVLSGAVTMEASTQFGGITAQPQGGGLYEQPLHVDTQEIIFRLDESTPTHESEALADLLSLRDGTVVAGQVTLTDVVPTTTTAGGTEITGGAVLSNAFHEALNSPEPVIAPDSDAGGTEYVPIDLDAAPEGENAPLPLAEVEPPNDDEVAEIPGDSPTDESATVADPSGVMVLGIRCPVDHHNHPDAQYCSQCGRKLGVNLTSVLLHGPRPPLGLFIVDDGTTIPIDADLVLGREPSEHEAVVAGTARPVEIPDDSLGLSRHHAMIRLDGWDVTVLDLDSSNGTFVKKADAAEWEELRGSTPIRLEMGDKVRVPGRELQLELHHIAS